MSSADCQKRRSDHILEFMNKNDDRWLKNNFFKPAEILRGTVSKHAREAARRSTGGLDGYTGEPISRKVSSQVEHIVSLNGPHGGINPKKIIVVTMCISGALAGLVGVNELIGVQHRLFLNFNYGYGFGGIAVALMGRNHPVGILIAAFLFGILYQGGAELDFELQNVSRDIVVVMQGLVILFCGGLEYLYRPLLVRFLAPIEGHLNE